MAKSRDRKNDIVDRVFVHQHVVERTPGARLRDADAARGVALGVGIDEECRRSAMASEAARLTAVVVFPTPPF